MREQVTGLGARHLGDKGGAPQEAKGSARVSRHGRGRRGPSLLRLVSRRIGRRRGPGRRSRCYQWKCPRQRSRSARGPSQRSRIVRSPGQRSRSAHSPGQRSQSAPFPGQRSQGASFSRRATGSEQSAIWMEAGFGAVQKEES